MPCRRARGDSNDAMQINAQKKEDRLMMERSTVKEYDSGRDRCPPQLCPLFMTRVRGHSRRLWRRKKRKEKPGGKGTKHKTETNKIHPLLSMKSLISALPARQMPIP